MVRGATHKTTTTALLASLKDSNEEGVWREFDDRYRPVLHAFARKLGLNRTDAEELAQSTLAEFTQAYRDGRYDRSKGRLSSWIIAIARNQAAERWRARGRAAGGRDDSVLDQVPDEQHATRLWTAEQERTIFARAWELVCSAGRTSESTLKAFELVAIRGMPAAAVAAECGLTVDEVYVAKSRVSRRLREVVEELTAAYTEDGP